MTPLPSASFADALRRHKIDLPPHQVRQLDQYCRLLWQWNEKLNLTRHTDYEKFVRRDLIDSLQLAQLLHAGERVLDVGTGGGVPGVILAITRPDLQMTLCESVAKKARAVQAIADQLELRVELLHARAEAVLSDRRYDALVARAVGPLWKILKWLEPHWPSIGRLLVIKGAKWLEERQTARQRGLLKPLELRRAAAYRIPGTDWTSVILKIWPRGTPEP